MQTNHFTYSFTLQADKKNVYLLMQRLLLMMNLALTIFLLISSWPNEKRIVFLCAFFLSVAFLVLIKKIYPFFFAQAHFLEKIVGLGFGVSWIAVGGYSPGIVVLLLTSLFSHATTNPLIQVGDKITIKTGFFKRNYSWDKIEQVILKDGLLTIDFKTNRLFQQPIGEKGPIDESAFNSFCKEHL